LGTFRDDAANAAQSTYTGTSGPASVYANYFWDDIAVMGPASSGLKNIADANDKIRLIPNPSSSGKFEISSDKTINEIEIINYAGKIIRKIKANELNGKYTVNVEDMPEGIYFIKIYAENDDVISKRFVKTH
jgi:hypothetical protein